jgi:hypothetical protein
MRGTRICGSCGSPPLAGSEFCWSCSASTRPEQVVCVKCGADLAQSLETRDWLVTFLLCLLLGIIGVHGIHRFYTGHIVIGVIQLLTVGGCYVWWIVDLILIVTGSYIDSEGRPLVRK